MIKNREIKIFYFSGTGNTELLVKRFSDYLINSGYDTSLLKMESDVYEDGEGDFTLGLVFPVAVQSTFPLVWDFIYGLPNGKGRDVFMFDTMEAFSGGIVGPLKKVLVRKGYNCIGAREFTMSSSLNTAKGKVEKGMAKNRKALQDVAVYAEDLIKGKASWGRVPLLSDMMRSIAKPGSLWEKMSRDISVSDGCIKCRKCQKNCPAGAIIFERGQISIDPIKCNCCMRCASLCPKQSIKYKGKNLLFSANEEGALA